MGKKKVWIIVASVVALLVIVYVICALTGNLKPASENETSKLEVTESEQSAEEKLTSLEFGEDINFGIEEIGGQVLSWVDANTDQYNTEDLEIVVVNPDVARVEFTNKSGKHQWYRVVALKSGRTGFYIQTKDGSVKTETKVIVVDRTQEELDAIPD